MSIERLAQHFNSTEDWYRFGKVERRHSTSDDRGAWPQKGGRHGSTRAGTGEPLRTNRADASASSTSAAAATST